MRGRLDNAKRTHQEPPSAIGVLSTIPSPHVKFGTLGAKFTVSHSPHDLEMLQVDCFSLTECILVRFAKLYSFR